VLLLGLEEDEGDVLENKENDLELKEKTSAQLLVRPL
jgi:hypothetical protein